MAIAHSVTLMQAAAPPKLNTTQQTFLALERAKGNTSITEDDIRRRYPSIMRISSGRVPPSLSNTEMGRSKPKLARSSMLFATSRGRRLQSRRLTCRDPDLAPKLL
jgi:hypothetical protein